MCTKPTSNIAKTIKDNIHYLSIYILRKIATLRNFRPEAGIGSLVAIRTGSWAEYEADDYQRCVYARFKVGGVAFAVR